MTPNPLDAQLWRDDIIAGYQQRALNQQMMAQQQSAQYGILGQQMGALAQLAGLGGSGLYGAQYARPSDYASIFKYTKQSRGLLDYRGRPFMARTKAGLHTRKTLEVLFWIGTGLFVAFGIIVPVTLKLGTMLWTWALT